MNAGSPLGIGALSLMRAEAEDREIAWAAIGLLRGDVPIPQAVIGAFQGVTQALLVARRRVRLRAFPRAQATDGDLRQPGDLAQARFVSPIEIARRLVPERDQPSRLLEIGSAH